MGESVASGAFTKAVENTTYGLNPTRVDQDEEYMVRSRKKRSHSSLSCLAQTTVRKAEKGEEEESGRERERLIPDALMGKSIVDSGRRILKICGTRRRERSLHGRTLLSDRALRATVAEEKEERSASLVMGVCRRS